MTEQPLIDAMTADIENPEPRLIYADWLEEAGDARAEALRLPVSGEVAARLIAKFGGDEIDFSFDGLDVYFERHCAIAGDPYSKRCVVSQIAMERGHYDAEGRADLIIRDFSFENRRIEESIVARFLQRYHEYIDDLIVHGSGLYPPDGEISRDEDGAIRSPFIESRIYPLWNHNPGPNFTVGSLIDGKISFNTKDC